MEKRASVRVWQETFAILGSTRHFGKQMTTDTKLQLRNITSKASLGYGSENWIINKRDAQKLEAA
jgi:hypothetical protein